MEHWKENQYLQNCKPALRFEPKGKVTLPLRKNLLDSKCKANNIYFAFLQIVLSFQYIFTFSSKIAIFWWKNTQNVHKCCQHC